MNRFLAQSLSIINGLVAILIIVGFTLAGRHFGMTAPGMGMMFGAIVGVIVAAFVCGLVAYMALIERHLAQMARSSGNTGAPAPRRQEPSL